MNSWKSWGIALVVALVVVLLGAMLLNFWMFPGPGVYARGGWAMGGCPMCGGWGWWDGGAWGIVGLLVMVFVPLAFLVVLALVIVWLVRSLTGQTNTSYMLTCPTCGRPVQPDWTVCPYCGTPLHPHKEVGL